VVDASVPTLRPSELERLAQLDEHNELSAEHVRSTSRRTGVPEANLWRWLDARRDASAPTRRIDVPEAATRLVGYRQADHRASRIITLTEAVGGELLPQISDGDVTTFLADSYRSLPPSEFERIDAVYTEGIRATCRWLAEHTGQPCRHDLDQNGGGTWIGPRGAGLAEYMLAVLQPRLNAPNRFHQGRGTGVVDEWSDILSLYRFLGGLIADSPGRGHTITRLRGAQAAFLLHGLRLDLPPDLAYSVGPGLTTTPIDHEVIARIRARTADPVDAAAIATALFTGATAMELNAIPCVALTTDALIFNGPIGYTHAPDLYVWVIPPPARPLLYEARAYQESRPTPNSKLFTGAIGGAGFRLRRLAAACEVTLPDLYHWHHSWIRQAGLLRMSEQPNPVRNTDLLFGLKLVPRPRRRRAR
jgi:hypothetical protein